MKLTLLERIVLPSILPAKGTFENMIVRRDIMERVKINQEELEKYQIKSLDGGLKWEPTADEFDYEFSEIEKILIVQSLKSLSEKGEISPDHLSLYKKFV